ncbi:MAG: sugar ABC transporter substrate-binding protein [Lachnospiraceae bacterium]|nr:sugar ABC transporter substrate-binding protein [Lachnospiraceae bacterium]
MKRILSLIIAVILVAAMVFLALKIKDPMYLGQETSEDDGTLILWYTDDALTDYLNDAAVSYRDETGVRIKAELVDGVEFLQKINHASVYEGEIEEEEPVVAPDIYITTHDNLMKAYYAGLASEITDPKKVINAINYPETSIHAITCNGKYVGYPLYYETNFLLYNKTYMANIAKQNIEEEPEFFEEDMEEIPEETTPEETTSGNSISVVNQATLSDDSLSDNSASDEELEPMGDEDATKDPLVLEKLSTMIPATIDDILTFANNYDAPEEVEAIFKWDVSDIFYNYFFVGNYMNVGGDDGDNNAYFNIYNQQAVDCLKVYQNINQFFSIDSKAVTYDSILREFIEGKTVFTVATTDAIGKIREAKENGEFEYDYGVAVLPDISSTLKARGLSETSTLVINGYSDKRETANDFAQYLSYDKAADVYKKTGKISCLKNVTYEDEEISNVMQEYEKSVPMPKMIEAGNYWVQLEIAFTKVWNGEDPDETLKELNDTIGAQIEELEQHVLTQESIKVGID